MALGGMEKTVVSHMHPSVMPNPLGRVEFGPVGRKIENLDPLPIFQEPIVDFGFLVVSGIVLNEIYPAASTVEGWQNYLIQKGPVSFPLEILLVMEIGELGGFQPHGAKYFLRMAFASCRNFRLAASPGPSGMQCRRLAESRLIGENNYGPFAFRVFFSFG